MKISENGLELIKEFEGMMTDPYLCPAKVATIGYGTTIYPDGRKVTLEDESIDEDEATYYLEETVNKVYGKTVNDLVKVDLTQNQYDALTSFTYNLGGTNFGRSTLLKKVNEEDHVGASKEFIRWNKSRGQVLAGLTRRREAEAKLYSSE